jgi:uncharacterized protein
MNIDDVINDFAAAKHDLPEASMQWALENWDEALPRFHELLQRYTDGSDRSKETENALFFVIHLIGEKREASAFPALCRLVKDAAAKEAIFGDAGTETLNGILISAYDGDARVLQDVIDSPDVNEFLRAAALEAMAYLSAQGGAIGEEAMRAYLLRLFAEMQPQGESFVWSAWALSAANLGYEDFESKVDDLFRRGFIDPGCMTFDNFKRQLRRTLADPERKAGFAYDRVRPFEDAIGTLSRWYWFSEQAKIDEARRAARTDPDSFRSTFDAPHVNIHRDVGRNDPCPCGSGKKYKKCCLV